ncbi:MAG TPA: phosphoesterase [Terriglobales bacterium]
MKKSLIVVGTVAIALLVLVFAQEREMVLRRVSLPSSKVLVGPTPGVVGQLNGFSETIAMSPDGRYAAILNDGFGTQKSQAHQSIAVLNLSTNQQADFLDDRLGEDAHQSYFVGLAFGSDGQHVYASMGSITDPTGEKAGDTGNGIAVYKFEDGKISPERFIKIPPQRLKPGAKVPYGLRKIGASMAIPYPAGIAVVPGSNGDDRLLVANNYADNVVLMDSRTGKVSAAFDLSADQVVPSAYPYTVVVAKDGRRAWCSLWNQSHIAELDLQKGTVARMIAVGDGESSPTVAGPHPTAMVLSPDGALIYVALSNADRVVAISTTNGGRAGVLDTKLPGQSVGGTYPSALALSADGSRLFVADSSVNAVAVFDVSQIGHRALTTLPIDAALGFIPTDWYPTALATAGDDLLIATSKGQGTGPNSGANLVPSGRRHREHPYIPTLLYGSLIRLNYKQTEANLASYTRRVLDNNLVSADAGKIKFAGGENPIKHVIYVIKENRTYDQVLGDLKVGNGDKSLVMYGADVTPNEHKLALQFGVLDNFYDSGEVSGDGHNWSTAAITSDYNEKTWQIAYRSRERTYDFQGTVADELPLEENIPDINDPMAGFLWDDLERNHASYRIYGEFTATIWCRGDAMKMGKPEEGTPSPLSASCPAAGLKKGEKLPANIGDPHGSASPWPWAVPMCSTVKPAKAALRGHIDEKYPDFGVDYPDQLRTDEFLDEFNDFVSARKENKGNQLPAFVLLYLPNDHTGGMRPGKPKPAASVADNDLAVGRVVEAVSQSPYWDDTAIFVLEDDAQDGADHVDAHRSIALVMSKYSPGSAANPMVDNRFYTTVSVVRTIESLLGLPPMNVNDAYAPLMSQLFSGAGNQPPFTADWSNRDNGLLYQVNPGRSQDAEVSMKLDFSRPDAADARVLNAILWRDRKGDTPMPEAKHEEPDE